MAQLRKLLSFVLIGLPLALAGHPPDSIGEVIEDGERYVLHVVESGETVFGLGRTYGTTIQAIAAVNPDMKDYIIHVGDTIRIPRGAVKPLEPKVLREPIRDTSRRLAIPDEPDRVAVVRFHEVRRGETLYSIARKYDVTVASLMTWNDMDNNRLRIGQRLKVSEGMVGNDVAGSHAGDEPYIEPVPARLKQNDVLSLQYMEQKSSRIYTEESHTGVASWIKENSYPPEKGFFALHRDLPFGTIIRVRNPINNLEVYAKVIGNLPKSEENKRLVVKLPDRAARALNVTDPLFRVHITSLVQK